MFKERNETFTFLSVSVLTESYVRETLKGQENKPEERRRSRWEGKTAESRVIERTRRSNSTKEQPRNNQDKRCVCRTGSVLPVIVEAPEPRQDVSEAGVAVQFGLTLGAFNGSFQLSAEEALMEEDSQRNGSEPVRLRGLS